MLGLNRQVEQRVPKSMRTKQFEQRHGCRKVPGNSDLISRAKGICRRAEGDKAGETRGTRLGLGLTILKL